MQNEPRHVVLHVIDPKHVDNAFTAVCFIGLALVFLLMAATVIAVGAITLACLFL
jgi:hypothetical protein